MSAHPEDLKIRILTGEYCHIVPQGDIAELDMGCGAGSFTVALAAKYPERRILAADVMLGRLRKVVKKMERANLENMDVLRVEARSLIAIMLPDASLDRIHILCPDPWPKARHSGHRLMSADFMMQISRVLKKGGILHFATDDEPYMAATVKNITESGLFERLGNETLADIEDVKTEFERQWLAQGKPVPHTAWRKIG